MKDDTSIILLRQPGSVEDPLTEIVVREERVALIRPGCGAQVAAA